jgi:hypothetical protein
MEFEQRRPATDKRLYYASSKLPLPTSFIHQPLSETPKLAKIFRKQFQKRCDYAKT